MAFSNMRHSSDMNFSLGWSYRWHLKPILSFLFTRGYICLLENNGETLLGLIVLLLANILDYIPVLFIVSKDSEELIKS